MKSIPDLIQKYIKAQNIHNIDQRLSCFASDATVLDEGETLHGSEAIRKWMVKTEAKYSQTIKARDFQEQAGQMILTAETSGNFPGSPIDLDYHFTVQNGLITHLEVKVSRKQ